MYLTKLIQTCFILGLLLVPPHTAVAAGPFVLPPAAVAPYVVALEATISESPLSITIEWRKENNVADYQIYRKAKDAQSWGSALATIPFDTNATTYTYVDTNVSVGIGYDYKVTKNNTVSPSVGYGYIHAGIKLPATAERGLILLVIDDTYQTSLASEITQLKADLAGDGWEVDTIYVARAATPVSVKALIQAKYIANQISLRSIMLLGKVPVPYSGQLNPDGHANHLGAWPTDQYYADMSNDWTDVEDWPNSSLTRQTNKVNDGKFDQSYTPSTIELEIGRVDLSGMTAFTGQTETDLLRQYLVKSHNYKYKVIDPQKRGVLIDSFGASTGESFSLGGWRNFSTLFGTSKITSSMSNYFSTLNSNSYAWTFATGAGAIDRLSGLGYTANYVTNAPRSVFNMLFGSYFGDWEYTNSLLKAPLASAGWGLVSVWSGRPQWHMYHMALGESVGYSTRLTQNNTTLFPSLPSLRSYDGQVHAVLLGDPTLRTDMLLPVSNVVATPTTGTGVSISWTASLESGLEGYHVYRSEDQYGPYERVTTSPVAGTSYTDEVPFEGGTFYYQVRAVKLESNPSGSYYNQSIGIISSSVSVGETNQAPGISGLPATTTITFGENLELAASITDDGLPGATTVSWSSISGPAAVEFADTTSAATTATFAEPGVYTIELTATDGELTSTATSTVTVSTDVVAPSTPGDFDITNISETSARLSWTASTDTIGVTGYQIYRNDISIGTTTNLYFEDTELSRSTTYRYTVRAFDNGANLSDPAVEQSITTSSTRTTNSRSSSTQSSNAITPPVLPPITSTPTTTPVPTILLSKTLKPGIIDAEVRILQQYLNARGFVLALTGPGSPTQETTKYGPATKASVSRLQAYLKSTIDPTLTVDGIVGPRMRKILSSDKKE